MKKLQFILEIFMLIICLLLVVLATVMFFNSSSRTPILITAISLFGVQIILCIILDIIDAKLKNN